MENPNIDTTAGQIGVDDEPAKLESWKLEDLEEPIENIVAELRYQIENGSYKYIIGDDASGRLPAIIFWDFLKKVYKDKGLKNPELYFIAGSGAGIDSNIQSEKRDALRDYIQPLSKEEDGRVLVVTDTLNSGSSLQPLTDILTERGIKYDVVTIGYIHGKKIPELQKKLGSEIHFGSHITPEVYGKNYMSGVEKRRKEVLATVSPDREQESVSNSRRDAKVIADRVFKKYKEAGDQTP